MKTAISTFIRRPSAFLLAVLGVLCIINGLFYLQTRYRWAELEENTVLFDIVTSGVGLTDLCVATEARYTRHPAVSDPVTPFMDHPGALEHFPTGSFWAPPARNGQFRGEQ